MDKPSRFQFTADFWNNGVMLNQDKTFQLNQLLLECFSAPINEWEQHDALIEATRAICDLFPELDSIDYLLDPERYELEEHLTNEMILHFDRQIRRFARAIETIDQLELSLPPYNHIYDSSEPVYCDRVFRALDKYPLLWKRPDYLTPQIIRGTAHAKYIPFPLMNPWYYPDSMHSEQTAYGLQVRPIYSVPISDFYQLLTELYQIYRDRARFLFRYFDCIDMLRNLLDKYINVSGHFQTTNERSESIARYEEENPNLRLSKFLASNLQMRARIIDHDGKPTFTESYVFEDTVSFLCVDFMKGLNANFLPKRCSNCGRWFLLTGGKYLEYCSHPLEDAPTKTCRDVGAQESYAQKCKNDPVWQTYLRAYKTHFARRKKGKMSPDEFRIWADNAILWRGQAERGELDFETYYSLIRE